jgi:hypothetical protein
VAIPQDDEQDTSREVALAAKAVDQENYTEAIGLAADVLEKEFDNPLALYVAGMALYRTKRHGLAYTLFKRCAQIDNSRPEPWNMLGVCAEQTWQMDLAERHFKESLKRNPSGHEAMENLSLVELNRCNPDESLKWAARAEAVGSKTHENNENRAMALLMKRDWSGWKYYKEASGGTKQRTLRNYCGEPMWNGEPGLVGVYGNQGMGDEIAFASCIPDAAKKASLIIECDERLEGLFKRSFPYAKVYGTRLKESRDWDHLVDYSIPVDSLPYFFRQKDEDFPGTPYLVADPERRLQWRALFDSYKKPVIGISWSGGTTLTGSGKRSLGLENWIPILKSIDAVWVSLEYKDRRQKIAEFQEETGIEIKNFERAVNVLNYDETAAMVAELDLVISVTTAVVHLSGALGKQCWCIAPNKPRWFYGLQGDLPWYKSVKMFRQSPDGKWPTEEITRRLRDGDFDLCRTPHSG